ncbi:hemin uptake protein HemP [Plasticicumulans acidivorans]|uniref:Hemin uptake protein hemP n=1 Tax=Plasticicumulans acidivorans TaxID=886464 RepID=A0A317MTM6_9GAMM|nr:hemin uptake protein HemP [Plasticicumulans acidivorans]PWV60445.1 hemin uptake protein hemP [Plasticicumulans acidivorans]
MQEKSVTSFNVVSHARPAQPRLSTRTLFTAGSVVLIEHEGEVYQLRRTRHGRLILTK